MSIAAVGLLSPGDMGHAVGGALREHGLDVLTCLDGRSDRTRALSAAAGLRDVPSLDDLVTDSDLVLSILVPAEAMGVCRSVAGAVGRTGKSIVFADCNAVSPRTSAAMDKAIREAGGRYVDGSIIGGPPRAGYSPRLYVSGPEASIVFELDGKGIDVRDLGEEVGRASAIKMCYAAATKGTSALWLAQLAAAEALGLTDELAAELMESQPAVYGAMEKGLPASPVEGLPLDRRDGGDRRDVRQRRTVAGLSRGRGRHVPAAERDAVRLRDAGGGRPVAGPCVRPPRPSRPGYAHRTQADSFPKPTSSETTPIPVTFALRQRDDGTGIGPDARYPAVVAGCGI